jgi:hypothetical protein
VLSTLFLYILFDDVVDGLVPNYSLHVIKLILYLPFCDCSGDSRSQVITTWQLVQQRQWLSNVGCLLLSRGNSCTEKFSPSKIWNALPMVDSGCMVSVRSLQQDYVDILRCLSCLRVTFQNRHMTVLTIHLLTFDFFTVIQLYKWFVISHAINSGISIM